MSVSDEPISFDHLFYKQASLIREALLNFAIISQLNAPGSILFWYPDQIFDQGCQRLRHPS
jgi:hypothetical protein